MKRNMTGAFGTSFLDTSSDFSSSLSNITSKMDSIKNSAYAQQIQLLGLSGLAKSAVESELDSYVAFGNTTANVANAYLQSKIDRIKDAWTTKVDITVGALVGEVTPFVKNPKEAVSLLVDKVDDLIEYMLGVDGNGGNTLKSLLDDLGTDFLEYMMNDPSMQSVMSNLTIVKTFGQVMKAYGQAEEMVVKILEKIEPLIPYLQIATNLASSYFSGGTSAVEAAQEMSELISKFSQQLLALAAGALRKYIFSIKIPMPSLLVGALNSLSVREAIRAGDFEYDWMKAIFDEDFYEHTMYSLQWQDSINSAITTTLGSYADVAKGALTFDFVNAKGEHITRGEFMKSRFMTTLTTSFMKIAQATARKTAYLTNIDDKEFTTSDEEYNTSDSAYSETASSQTSTLSEVISAHLSGMIDINTTNDIIVMSRNYCNT